TRTFPIKPKLKPKASTQSQTSESKYWSSFKTQQIPDLKSSVPSLSFSPSSSHLFAAAHSAFLTLFSSLTLAPSSSISSFSDVVSSSSFRSDGSLLAASDISGLIQVFYVKTRTPLRRLRSHAPPVRFVKYPSLDKLHLVSGGDDSLVKYWDVAGESVVLDLHKDYVRCGDCSPGNAEMFVTGSYDHRVKVWDVRVDNSRSVMEVNHGAPVEDVIYLPSGGLIATAGGNSVKIWDLIGGGKMVYSMESHNKTVTSICVGKVGKEGLEESMQYRIFSVGLDGYMKVFDYAKMKVTHSMRFPAPLMSVGFSPDSMTRVIGTSNGVVFAGRRKAKDNVKSGVVDFWSLGSVEKPHGQLLRSSYHRYFHRGQSDKPSQGDYLVMRPKKVKLAEHEKLLKKFRHKEALVLVLGGKNPETAVAVMEELVARRKLLTSVSNLDEELGLLLMFLQKHSTMPRHSNLLIGLTKKVLEMRAEDIRASDALKGHVRNLKRSVEEEIRIQQSLLEIQGIISPLLRIAGRR
ncbi:LOW QUALITY PROTEIN: WD40 domain-containing protein/UTP15_C domain-containing protein, partial [Cephalotus follicularis]